MAKAKSCLFHLLQTHMSFSAFPLPFIPFVISANQRTWRILRICTVSFFFAVRHLTLLVPVYLFSTTDFDLFHSFLFDHSRQYPFFPLLLLFFTFIFLQHLYRRYFISFHSAYIYHHRSFLSGTFLFRPPKITFFFLLFFPFLQLHFSLPFAIFHFLFSFYLDSCRTFQRAFIPIIRHCFDNTFPLPEPLSHQAVWSPLSAKLRAKSPAFSRGYNKFIIHFPFLGGLSRLHILSIYLLQGDTLAPLS